MIFTALAVSPFSASDATCHAYDTMAVTSSPSEIATL
jgi:hypothetical protein